MPLKSKIFTGVFFHKISVFCYKRKRQLFYYEGSSSYITLNIFERVYRVLFSEFLRVVASENTPADKNIFKVDKKGMFQECYSEDFMISLKNIFKVCDGVFRDFRKSSGLYIKSSEGLCDGVSSMYIKGTRTIFFNCVLKKTKRRKQKELKITGEKVYALKYRNSTYKNS